MKKFNLILFLVLPLMAQAGNIPKTFNTRPVLPTVEKLRNVDWTWQNFLSLPNIGKIEKDTQFKGLYSLTQTINDDNPQTTVTFYGTKDKPEFAVIEARTWGAGNTQDTSFVRLDMLKGNIPLKSNCNFKGASISHHGKEDGNKWESGATLDFQQAYSLPKNTNALSAGRNDLYVASSQVETYVVTGSFQTQAYTQSVITPNKNKLGQAVTKFGWNTDKKGKKVACSIN